MHADRKNRVLAIADQAHDNSQAWPDVEFIARKARLSARAVPTIRLACHRKRILAQTQRLHEVVEQDFVEPRRREFIWCLHKVVVPST